MNFSWMLRLFLAPLIIFSKKLFFPLLLPVVECLCRERRWEGNHGEMILSYPVRPVWVWHFTLPTRTLNGILGWALSIRQNIHKPQRACRQSQLKSLPLCLLTYPWTLSAASIHFHLVDLNLLFFSFRGFYWNQCPFKMMKEKEEF